MDEQCGHLSTRVRPRMTASRRRVTERDGEFRKTLHHSRRASAGGVEALKRLASDLPADLPAAVFVVLHVGQTSLSVRNPDRAGLLRTTKAESGEALNWAEYVAPPDFTSCCTTITCCSGAVPANLARPAIDSLFRSAACSYGARVMGVSPGSMSDGTAGLRAIKAVGGVTVVQDPNDAAGRTSSERAAPCRDRPLRADRRNGRLADAAGLRACRRDASCSAWHPA